MKRYFQNLEHGEIFTLDLPEPNGPIEDWEAPFYNLGQIWMMIKIFEGDTSKPCKSGGILDYHHGIVHNLRTGNRKDPNTWVKFLRKWGKKSIPVKKLKCPDPIISD